MFELIIVFIAIFTITIVELNEYFWLKYVLMKSFLVLRKVGKNILFHFDQIEK